MSIKIFNFCSISILSNDILILSKELEFIFNSGTRTIISLNYFGSNPPSFIVDIIAQSFSDTEFIITFNSSSETGFGPWEQSIQIWWNGITVPSNNIKKLGNGLYNVSLTPIFVAPGEDPILLNMTITAAHHSDKYFETYLAVDPDVIDKTIPKKKEPAIPGYNLILLIVVISIISIVLIRKRFLK